MAVSISYMLLISEFCTFSTTGEVGIEQMLYNCITCNMQDGHCICKICINNCHKGHKVVFSEEDAEGYCDCGEQGSRGIRSCNMLKGTEPSYLPPEPDPSLAPDAQISGSVVDRPIESDQIEEVGIGNYVQLSF